MKDKTIALKSSNSFAHKRGYFIAVTAIALALPTSVFCQEFDAILKELNAFESKLTRIVQNEAVQRKAADSAIVKAIGKNPAAPSPVPDSVLLSEINHLRNTPATRAKNLRLQTTGFQLRAPTLT